MGKGFHGEGAPWGGVHGGAPVGGLHTHLDQREAHGGVDLAQDFDVEDHIFPKDAYAAASSARDEALRDDGEAFGGHLLARAEDRRRERQRGMGEEAGPHTVGTKVRHTFKERRCRGECALSAQLAGHRLEQFLRVLLVVTHVRRVVEEAAQPCA
jgi:hypothetical protein